LWSLSVEEQFYLLWPLALLHGFRRRAVVAWFAMAAAAGFRLAVALSGSPQAFAYVHYSFFGTMDSIAAGCLLAIYEPKVREKCKWMADSIPIVIAVPLTAWIMAGAFWADKSTAAVLSLGVIWGAVPLLIALWIFLLIERRGKILNNPIASAIGVLSYSLYLWQQPFTEGHGFSVPVILLMVAACATASYLVIERPMLKLGASLKSRKLRPIALNTNLATSISELKG
jgi:peptidoglycan/LPS O-acetylase OafA/YrhL